MQTANAVLRLNRGTEVPLKGLTPAEMVILHIIHNANVGQDPIHSITDINEIDRSPVEEHKRLRAKYGHLATKKGDKLITLIYPGLSAPLPEDFDDVKTSELQYDGVTVGATDFGTSGGAAITR